MIESHERGAHGAPADRSGRAGDHDAHRGDCAAARATTAVTDAGHSPGASGGVEPSAFEKLYATSRQRGLAEIHRYLDSISDGDGSWLRANCPCEHCFAADSHASAATNEPTAADGKPDTIALHPAAGVRDPAAEHLPAAAGTAAGLPMIRDRGGRAQVAPAITFGSEVSRQSMECHEPTRLRPVLLDQPELRRRPCLICGHYEGNPLHGPVSKFANWHSRQPDMTPRTWPHPYDPGERRVGERRSHDP
jgi:hypothetical protein